MAGYAFGPNETVVLRAKDVRIDGDSSFFSSASESELILTNQNTFFMLPTAYTLEPGHTLSLVLTTWDTYRAFLDEDYTVDPNRDAQYSFYTYGSSCPWPTILLIARSLPSPGRPF